MGRESQTLPFLGITVASAHVDGLSVLLHLWALETLGLNADVHEEVYIFKEHRQQPLS